MLEFLSAPIDPTRAHEVGVALSWHARLMVVSWGVLAPLAVLIARFGKIWPRQDWPNELDNPMWWRFHWMTQTLVMICALIGFVLIFQASAHPDAPLHRRIGYGVLLLGLIQYLSGVLRGTKGGPTDTTLRGDHFDMTARRVVFECLHKSLGYLALMLTMAATLTGLWAANALMWMPLLLGLFWLGLALCFVLLQGRKYTVDTYQAIWGPDPNFPGNQRKPIGWGISRPDREGD
jgi:hypothetical protein